MRSLRMLTGLLAAVCACEEAPPSPPAEWTGLGGEPGSLGRLAYFRNGTARLYVVDLATGATVELVPPIGPPGAVALEPDGSHLAFSVELGIESHVFVADATTLAIQEVVPPASEEGPRFAWGRGGWFSYGTLTNVGEDWHVVTAESAVARSVGPTEWILPSPREGSFLYTHCASRVTACPSDVFLDDVAGTGRRILSSVPGFFPVAFTQDGRSLISHERRDATSHLIVRDLEAGGELDLGTLACGRCPPDTDLSRMSPDGREVLANGHEGELAVAVDGSGVRLIVPRSTRGQLERIGFSSRGDILYETSVDPPGFGQRLQRLWIFRAGLRTLLRRDEARCQPVVVSPSGRYAAWPCAAGIFVFSLDDLALVATYPQGTVLGFDREDRGVVIVPREETPFYSIEFRGHDGTRVLLGKATGPESEVVRKNWPPYDYAP